MFEQKKFDKPTAEIINFDNDDVILTSGEGLGEEEAINL